MPVPMTLEITMEHAVTKPTRRAGAAVLCEIASVLGATVWIDDGIARVLWLIIDAADSTI